MAGFVRRNTIGRVTNAADTVRSAVGQSIGSMEYVQNTTSASLSRGLKASFGSRAMKQLGDEIQTKQTYRIYTSMHPPIQSIKGRLAVTPKALSTEVNKGVTDPNDTIHLKLGSDGVMRYGIQTSQGPRVLTLKKFDKETRDRIGERLSSAMDNMSDAYAKQAALADMMGGESVTVSYVGSKGERDAIQLGHEEWYDLMQGNYRDPSHRRYNRANIVDRLMPQLQEAFVAKLVKMGKVSEGTTRDHIVSQLDSMDFDSLDTKQINAYAGIHKRNHGVSRVRGRDGLSVLFGDLSKNSPSSTASSTIEQATATPDVVREYGSPLAPEIQTQLRDYMMNPSVYTYHEIEMQMHLWMDAGQMKSGEFYNKQELFKRMQKEGRLKADVGSTGAIESENSTPVVSLAGERQMQTYMADSADYTRSEVEEYLADLGAKGQITEKRYDEYLKKMDTLTFKDANIQAQAVA